MEEVLDGLADRQSDVVVRKRNRVSLFSVKVGQKEKEREREEGRVEPQQQINQSQSPKFSSTRNLEGELIFLAPFPYRILQA